jgi:hypothetical protein
LIGTVQDGELIADLPDGRNRGGSEKPVRFLADGFFWVFPLRTEKARPPNVLKESSAASRRIISATH